MSSRDVGKDALMSGGAGSPRAAAVIGVLGAGTMGSGIAQLAARFGARALLHDPLPAALQKGLERARDGLSKEAAKGKLTDGEAEAASARLEAVEEMAAFAPCELVIEAVPERIELKHAIYAQLSEIVAGDCVLASNTSSLLVTALGPAARNPERVVGMHFFNP
ncbi:MAG TPA: 3-hydroxyacyl-CoA dehydrogenase NAD-binding domain-containing protein, partial [Solirubrobacteraceae bacterium]|nr:3-hydroxyacyl-CoA dehydrogenase NAD-binding domain-containing protein [Solirubrobacteraceae bacterium]